MSVITHGGSSAGHVRHIHLPRGSAQIHGAALIATVTTIASLAAAATAAQGHLRCGMIHHTGSLPLVLD